jgi:hypothetical protein
VRKGPTRSSALRVHPHTIQRRAWDLFGGALPGSHLRPGEFTFQGDRPYGVEALMRDNSGNWIVLVEPREYTDADFEGFGAD